MHRRTILGAAFVMLTMMTLAAQEKTVLVGGAPMYPSQNMHS